MVTAYEVLLPEDFPAALVSFRFYFQNYGSGMINLYHVAGMELIYTQIRVCYVHPDNIFFQLLKLQNTEQPHIKKYDLLLMKGWFDRGKLEVDIRLVNADLFAILRPEGLSTDRLQVEWLPKPGEELAIADPGKPSVYNHFRCREVLPAEEGKERPVIWLEYLESGDLPEIINAWLDGDEHKLRSL